MSVGNYKKKNFVEHPCQKITYLEVATSVYPLFYITFPKTYLITTKFEKKNC